MKLKKIAALLLSAAMLASLQAAGCGSSVNAEAVAATLDDKEISIGLANFIAQVQAVQMDATFLSYYGENMWSSDSGSGTTMEQSVKDSVMERIQEYYLMDAHTADYKVELTDEEKSEITEAAAKFLADNSADAQKAMGATQETVEEMLRLYKIQSKMRAAIEEEIDTNVTAEECAQKTFSYVRFNKTEDTETSTENEKDEKSDAEDFLKAAADDMKKAAETGEYTIQTCSYGAGDLTEDENTTSMELDVLKAADKLQEQELADSLVETDNGYYVIRMDSTDDKAAAETKKESILTQRRSDKYDEVLQGYKDDCKWKINESEWEKVNFDELYTVKQEDTAIDDTATEDTAADDTKGTDSSTDGAEDTAGTDSSADETEGNTAGTDSSADKTEGDTAGTDSENKTE